MRCVIWYHLHNLKNVKNTHGEVLFLVKLQASTLLKVKLLHGRFLRFLKCTNGTKSRNASHDPANHATPQPATLLKKRLWHHLCKISFLIKLQASACNLIKEALAPVLSCEFCEISKNTFFTEHLQATASHILFLIK